MKIMRYDYFKDDLPKNSIKAIEDILHKLKIDLDITSEKDEMTNFYSIRINLKKCSCIGVNGKGTSYEYALASAYGELMERMQNKYLYDCYSLSKYFKGNGNVYSMDEKKVLICDIMADKNEFVEHILNKYRTNDEKMKFLKQIYPELECLCIPYYDLNNNKVCYLPKRMIDICCESNGMCAGNSKQEAAIQGICEILERYSMYRILNEKIIIPTIPEDYLDKFPSIKNIISIIEKQGNEVICKDCSLNYGIPIIGIIIINKKNRKFAVKFGCHLSFEVAFFRAATELLQGNKLDSIKQLMELDTTNRGLQDPDNIDNLFVTGKAKFPIQIFLNDSEYKFQPYKDISNQTNFKLLEYLISILKERGYNIFIRDVSYLGFTSFHIIIPRMSEIIQVTENDIELVQAFDYISTRLIKNLKDASDKDLLYIIDYMGKMHYDNNKSLGELVGLPVSDNFYWYNMKTDLFISLVYYKTGKYEESHGYMGKFCSYLLCQFNEYDIDKKIQIENVIEYFNVLRDYIGCLVSDIPIRDIEYLLNKFYEKELVKQAICYLTSKDNILSDFGKFPCEYETCDGCDFKIQCNFSYIIELHKKLTCMEKNNIIDQNINRQMFTY